MENKFIPTISVMVLFVLFLLLLSLRLLIKIVRNIGNKDSLILALSTFNTLSLIVRLGVYAFELVVIFKENSVTSFLAQKSIECVISDIPWYLFSIGDFITVAIWCNFVICSYRLSIGVVSNYRFFRRRLFASTLFGILLFSLTPNVLFTIDQCDNLEGGLAYLLVSMSHWLLCLGFLVIGIRLHFTLKQNFAEFYATIRREVQGVDR